MRPHAIVERFRETKRLHGTWAAAHDLEHRALNRVGRFDVLRGMLLTFADVKDPSALVAPGFAGRFLSTADLDRWSATSGYELDRAFVTQAAAKGDRCHGLFDGDVLASYGWYSNAPTAIDEHFVVRFDPRYTYMYKGFTLPTYRGKRLHAIGMLQALRDSTEQGQLGLISYVMAHNFSSLKSTERMGYRIFGSIYLLGVGPHRFSHATSGCKPYAFRVESITDQAAHSTARRAHRIDAAQGLGCASSDVAAGGVAVAPGRNTPRT